MQVLLAGLLVAGCAGFALWSLAPAGLRLRLVALLRAHWPSAAARLARSASAAHCGGCKGCADGAKVAVGPSGVAPIIFHRRG